jgi:hypothetical protein
MCCARSYLVLVYFVLKRRLGPTRRPAAWSLAPGCSQSVSCCRCAIDNCSSPKPVTPHIPWTWSQNLLWLQNQRRRQSAATRGYVCIVRLGAVRFSQRAQLTQRQSGTCTALDWPDTGRAWWTADGAWSAYGRMERAASRGLRPFKGEQHHTHTQGAHTRASPLWLWNRPGRVCPSGAPGAPRRRKGRQSPWALTNPLDFKKEEGNQKNPKKTREPGAGPVVPITPPPPPALSIRMPPVCADAIVERSYPKRMAPSTKSDGPSLSYILCLAGTSLSFDLVSHILLEYYSGCARGRIGAGCAIW